MTSEHDTCPHCGSQRATVGERCPDCGRSRLRSRPRHHRRLAIAAFVAGGTAVIIIAASAQSASEERERERAAQQRAVEQLRREIARRQSPRRGSAIALRPRADANETDIRAARRALVVEVEAVITQDAQRRDRSGELDGPIKDASCKPISSDPRAIPDDENLNKPIGRYDCTARIRDVPGTTGGKPVAVLGHPYVAALNFQRFSYVYCRNTPAQGERGVALVFVRLDRACLAARGRAMGTGYADVPDPTDTAP